MNKKTQTTTCLTVKEKVFGIEFFRIIFTLVIIFYHYAPGPVRGTVPIYLGFVPVEIFFIIAGYFMLSSVDKFAAAGKGIFEYMKSRWVRLAPAMILVLVIAMILGILSPSNLVPYATMGYALAPNIVAKFTPLWFIGVLFWVQSFYFAILLKTSDRDKAFFWIAVLVFVGFSYLLISKNFWLWNVTDGVNTGLVRGLASVGLGTLLARAIPLIKFPKVPRRALWTALEVVLIFTVLGAILFMKRNPVNYLTIVVSFVGLMVCMTSSMGWISTALNKWKWCGTVGKYCFFAFVCQQLISIIVPKLSGGSWQVESVLLIILPFLAAVIYENVIVKLWKKAFVRRMPK